MMNTIRKDQNGFTLVELLIALAIMGIVTGGLYNLYIQNSGSWTCQNIISDVQQTARVAVDTLNRDLTMVGFDAKNTDGTNNYYAIDAAGSDTITFQYRNEDNKYIRYTYWLDGTDLKRRSVEWDSSTTPGYAAIGTGGSVSTIAANVASFAISYYDGNAAEITAPVATPAVNPSGDNTNSIRLIKLSVTVNSADECPLDNQNKAIKLTTEVRPRNLGIGSATIDSTPPSCPADLVLSDPKTCGELGLSWIANNSLEGVSGYKIYYGQVSGVYTAKLDVGNVTSSTVTGLSDNNTYYVKVTAYDDSGNESLITGCTEVSQSIVADNPGQPAGLDATASTSASGATVTLGWTSNDVRYSTNAVHDGGIGPDTDVSSYEIWRKKSSEDDTAWALRGTASGVSTNSYMDTLDESDKCTTFDYKIRAVTSCGATTYTSAFSSKIYGDGAKTTATDVPTDGTTNTTPSDTVPPAAPTGPGTGGSVLSQAGYRRTFMNWNNAADSDLATVEIRYANSALGTPPYPTDTTDGTAVENGNSGVFTAVPSAVGESYTHYGPSGCSTDPACLEDGNTYAYSLFSVDTCGNESEAAITAQTTIGQCGEESSGPSAGAPSTPSNFSVLACNTYNFSWNRIDDTYPTGEYDLAGYYLYKSVDGGATYSKVNADLILNPAAGSVTRTDLGTDPDTNASYIGHRYMYKAYSIDCIRETRYGQDPTAATAAPDPGFPGGIASEVLTVTPGKLTFANNTNVTTGDLTDPVGNPAYGSLVTAFNHNSVKLNIENTSYGPVEWDGADISWDNSAAYLKAIYRTDTVPEERIWSSATPVASGSPVSITSFRVDGSTSPPNTTVPLRFIFTDIAGNVGVDQDMRQKTITFSNMEYTRIFYRNTAELNAPCTNTSDTETIVVPLNPTLGGTIQDKPSSPTFAWAVPGVANNQSPGQILVGGASTVNVYTNEFLDAGASMVSATLYYAVTDQTVTTAPTSGYTALPITGVSTNLGALYTGSPPDNRIPANPGDRIWYYIVLVDDNGNFDRDPEITTGTYTYDQQALDPCLDTPNEPASLSGTTSGNTSVTLSWTAPTLNTDGSDISDTIVYDVYRSDAGIGGPFVPVQSDVANLSYTDTGLDLAANSYVYQVKAKDNCSTPNVSSFSNSWQECVGAGTGITITASPTTITADENFDLTISSCVKTSDGISADTITVNGIADTSGDQSDFTMTETGDTGTFTIDNVLYGQTTITTSDSGACTPTAVCRAVDSGGDTVSISYGGETEVVTVNPVLPDPCALTPDPPAGLSITSSTFKVVSLSWVEPDAMAANNYGLSNYTVYQNVNRTGWVAVGTVSIGTSSVNVTYAGTTATLNGSSSGNFVKNNVIDYKVVTLNSCPVTSSDSNTVQESET